MTDYAKLKTLCEAATPGPHEARYCPGLPTSVCEYGVVAGGIETCRVWKREDVEFYAAANPDVVLGLLDERDRLREALTRVAGQKLTTELNVVELAYGDFEDAYDCCVNEARDALGGEK